MWKKPEGNDPLNAKARVRQRFVEDAPLLATRKPSDQRPISVAVLVDLVRHPGAGGHVKAWERFADAARQFSDALDLTVYYLGDGISETRLADNVRIRTVPPAFGTANLPWLRNGGGDTDLASYNPHLARQLLEHDVFHATSAFAFAKTAEVMAKSHHRPLVSSLHTDAAKFARVYTGEIIERLVGHSMLSRWLIDGVRVPDMSARKLTRARDRILAASDHILVSAPRDEQSLRATLPETEISFLRRGIDKAMFTPARRDRQWLMQQYGIPIKCPVLLFAGRVDETKRVLTVAKATQKLLDEGAEIHVIIAGKGSEQRSISELLGDRVTLTGNVAQDQLARLMASADMFVFPSETEIVCNVVIEAKASGLPVIVTSGATTSQLITTPGNDGLITRDGSVDAYASMIAGLLEEPERRRQIASNARAITETSWPDWSDVLIEDLMPVWQRVKTQNEGSKKLTGSRLHRPSLA
jgi:glycosyltransferase involved in cell wall biosynthesis